MINSGLYSKSVIKQENDIIGQQFKPDIPLASSQTVNRSILFHFYHSYIKSIFQDTKMSKVQKIRSCQQFGFNIGCSVAQQQSQGFMKNFIPKANQQSPKPFIAEMKLLYTKIWSTIFDSTAKLFFIVSQNDSYKIQDKSFAFTKPICLVSGSGISDSDIKVYKQLIYEFVKGVIQGFLDKFNLKAEILYNENSENSIYYEVKQINKKYAK